MPIRKFLSGATFTPEQLANMAIAFERLKVILNLDIPADPQIEVLAKKIISVASEGIFDPAEIERIVLADID